MIAESILRLERSSDFSWDEVGDGSGITGSDFARALTSSKDDLYWIYDHVPKTGGSEFNRLCEELLDPYDHLFVPWPGSWLGITVGRAMRARIIHGHGARMAPLIMPWRPFRLAVNLREPLSLLVSHYQQEVRYWETNGCPFPDLEEWIDFENRRLAGVGLNRQTDWVVGELFPLLNFPYYEDRCTKDAEQRLQSALGYLDECELIAPTEQVRELFAEMCVRSNLELRAHPASHERPANSSAVSSAELLQALPGAALAGLRQLTENDRPLYEAATRHPQWMGKTLVSCPVG